MHARIRAELGSLVQASELVNGLAKTLSQKIDSGLTLQDRKKARFYAHLLLVLNRLDEAQVTLQALEILYQSAGHLGWLVEVLVLQALVWQKKSMPRQALTVLKRAMELAEPESYQRVFLDGGAPILGLLHLARARDIEPAYTARLLAEATQGASPEQPSRSPLIAPLSKRELELLGLIQTGHSNKEIASRLVISIGTVKRHMVNIFNKLDVKNRTEAVAKVRQLGLL